MKGKRATTEISKLCRQSCKEKIWEEKATSPTIVRCELPRSHELIIFWAESSVRIGQCRKVITEALSEHIALLWYSLSTSSKFEHNNDDLLLKN